MTDMHTWGLVGVIAVVTALLRFLPFAIWSNNKKTPEIIVKLGKVLPFAMMGMLVVYCLKDINFTEVTNFLPTLIACALVGVLYIWKRNTLLSITVGTVGYMFLVQFVF